GVLAVLARPRDDMEGPQVFARARVEAADVVGRRFFSRLHTLAKVVGCRRGHAGNDDDVADDDWPAAIAIAGDAATVVTHLRQIDRSVGAPIGIALPGPGIQRDQVRAIHREDAGVVPVGPVRDASSRSAAWRRLALVVRRDVEPEDLPGCRI